MAFVIVLIIRRFDGEKRQIGQMINSHGCLLIFLDGATI